MQRILIALIILMLALVSCKLKEEVVDPGDDDDQEEELTILFPNGNDSLMVGSDYDILWESKLQTSLVLEFSTDNGSTWTSISDSVSNTGSFTWGPVPDRRSTRCLMRIRTANGSHSDQSDSTWSIIENINKVLFLTSPSGGEIVPQGTSLDITWISSKVQTVNIEFSSNNGNTWQPIVNNFDATKAKYTWENVPAINSSNCLIRITDAASPTVSAIMNSTFSIIIDVNLKILTPNGGEEIEGGLDYEIKWYSKDIASVKIEYSINNGLNWNTIVNNLTNTGVYLWNPVPSTPSSLSKLKITDVDNPANVDESDTTFSILPEASITILSPTSESKWKSGTSEFIQWNSKNVANVKIEYSTNNGAEWIPIAEDAINDGSFQWKPIPTINSSLCNIRISDASDGRPVNIMDNPFTIYTGEDILEVYTPNGGESWEIGTDQEIKWFAHGVTSLRIDYTTNNGQSWSTIANSVANTGTYVWKGIPNTPSSLAKVRISDAADDNPKDESDGTFTISQESQIEVIEPNGGEQLQAGSSANIRWTSTNVENVKIQFTTNNGATWTTITESTPSIGFFVWDGIPDISSQQCRVKVSDAIDGIPSDVSDGNFTITNQVVQTLTVISPNGGEVWQSGVSELITWQSSGVDSVKIEYSLNNGTTWTVIEESIENADAYTWNPIPIVDDFKRSSKIRISDAADGKPIDESNGTFTIKPIPSITLLSPNGGEEFVAGESFDITWTSIGIERVHIEKTSNNGLSWDTVAVSILNTGTYETEFAIPSTEYKVRVRDAATGSPVDASDNTFTILPKLTKTITVTRPNGGENWLTSKDPNNPNYHEIRWESTNIEQVDIQYSLNGGATWTNITTGVPSNGLYNWRVPESIQFRTDLAKIRIRESNNENLFDDTDGFFTIHPQVKLLRVEQPFGGEYFFCPDDDPMLTLVTWTSAGISHVKIEYSYNNGATWEVLDPFYESSGAYGIPANLVGQFFYDEDSTLVFVADHPTTLARIRITDVTPNGVPYVPPADPTISDVSEIFNLGICEGSSATGLKPNNEAVGRNRNNK